MQLYRLSLIGSFIFTLFLSACSPNKKPSDASTEFQCYSTPITKEHVAFIQNEQIKTFLLTWTEREPMYILQPDNDSFWNKSKSWVRNDLLMHRTIDTLLNKANCVDPLAQWYVIKAGNRLDIISNNRKLRITYNYWTMQSCRNTKFALEGNDFVWYEPDNYLTPKVVTQCVNCPNGERELSAKLQASFPWFDLNLP